MAEVNGGLLMIRRALPDGYGKLALPGGYQGLNETWQEAGVREVFELIDAPDASEAPPAEGKIIFIGRHVTEVDFEDSLNQAIN